MREYRLKQEIKDNCF